MIKRTIEIARLPTYVGIRYDHLQLRREDDATAAVPCEDVGILVIDQLQSTITAAALARLAELDAIVIVCGRDHHPVGMYYPLADHSQVVPRIGLQVAAPRPLKKRLWRQIVRGKLKAQARNLPPGPARTRLLELARTVRSGDPANSEAQGARVYWSAWLPGEAFSRDPCGNPPNGLLNYGYAIIRAALARALVSRGLHPVLGLQHHNRANAFCLADDLIEPLRPLVDARVRELSVSGRREVTPDTKRSLLELLTLIVKTDVGRGPLWIAIERYVASLVACFERLGDTLEIPIACSSTDTAACGS